MFVAVTNDNGFYPVKDEDEAVDLATIFEIDFNDWAFNIFEVDANRVYFTGIDYVADYRIEWHQNLADLSRDLGR